MMLPKHVFAACCTCAALLLAVPASAAWFGGNKPKPAAASGQIGIEELNELTNGYADRYMTYIINAVQKIEAGNPNAEQRRYINQVQLVQVSSIYDIATSADPYTQLIDLTLVVTLQAKKWIDDDEAEKRFGERGKYLIDASRKAREDIWKVAARVLKPEQLEQLDYLITDWHKRNRDVEIVSYVRFDEFAASRGKSIIADVKSGGGLLAPIDDAKKSVDEVRLLAERAFFLGKRMPFMVNWHVKAAVSDAMADPGLANLQSALPQISQSVERISKTADRLPADIAKERTAILDAVVRERPFIQGALLQARGTVQDADKLAASALKVTQSLEGLTKQVDQSFMAPGRNAPPNPNAKPFDIAQYTQTAVELTGALKEANSLLAGTSQLLQSPSLDRPLALAGEQGARLVDFAFWRAAALILLFFVLLVIYRAYATWMAGRLARSLARGAA